MNSEYTPEALAHGADSLPGKPLVVYIAGERRKIGTITAAKIDNGKLFVAAQLDTEDA